MHSLLLRQLRRFFGESLPSGDNWQHFLQSVSEAYENSDSDRLLIERSLELASQELIERNCKLRDELGERRKVEAELRLLAKVFESGRDGIFIAGADRNIVAVNPAFVEITGYSFAEVVGKMPGAFALTAPGGRERYAAVWAGVGANGHWQGELHDRRRNGEIYPTWASITAALSPEGTISHYIGIFSDIGDRKAAEARIHHLAYHDDLTGLPNRSLLRDRLEQAIAHARRKRTRVAILFIDLDRFKTINDSLGHQAGDRLLKEVSERLKSCVRSDDTVCRLGGDEFMIILSGIGDASQAAIIAEKIAHSVSRPCRIEDTDIHVSPSTGISIFPDDGEDIDVLIRNADAAMYHAKDSGRDNYQFFTAELNVRAFERLSMENNLRRGIDRGEMVLHYQPKVDLESGALVGFEALVRWRHPDLGLVSPDRFIPLAEETGLIVPLGEWVLRSACKQLREWRARGLPPVPVAVNLSARQFKQRDLVRTVGAILDENGVAPSLIELELTESMVMNDPDAAIVTLHELRERGIKCSIDDFGTGYSSLSYLKRFPIDRLKIDRSFVRDIASDHDDEAIVASIISLAHNLKLCVIAEGVETREQLAFLRSKGCDQAQGYLFSRPLAAADAEARMREWLEAAGPAASWLASAGQA